MIPRRAAQRVTETLQTMSAVALLGPRQVGKTTLALEIADRWQSGATYLDLERPSDLRRLADADRYLRDRAPTLTVIDEVHRVPDLFTTLRGVIDHYRRSGFRHGQFLLLGSASLDLINLSAESLAGRIAHVDLSGVNLDEAADAGISADRLWLRGGFPDSLTARDDAASLRWRQDLIRSYLERDVPMFAPRLPAETLRRLWTMLAHSSGGLFNASRLAASLGVSGPTVDRYVDLLVDLGLVRRLQPWHANVGKRLTKSPKIYVRDSGLLHALLDLGDLDAVRGHPAVGGSYESHAVEAIIDAAGPSYQPHFYRTARGDEVDLLLVRGGEVAYTIEVKLSTAPTVSPGFHRCLEQLRTPPAYLVHPGDTEPFPIADGVTGIGLHAMVRHLHSPGQDG
ncbi:MAG: ATP-binding protein [Nocardioides sp.]